MPAEDENLEPLPDDFVIPDDASALGRDRDAHRLSGLPRMDAVVTRSLFAAIIGFVCTFAMYAGIISLNAGCKTEEECTSNQMSLIPTLIIILTPVVVAFLLIAANRPALARRVRLTLATIGIILPPVLVLLYYALL